MNLVEAGGGAGGGAGGAGRDTNIQPIAHSITTTVSIQNWSRGPGWYSEKLNK